MPLVAALLLATACGSTTEPVTAGSILVSPPVDTLPAGSQRQFAARIVRSPGDTVAATSVIWSSSDPDIAMVDADGLVTAVQSGSVTITALVADERGRAEVAVERRFAASAVAVNPTGVCALDMAGQAWCFGDNSFGQLGLGYAGARTSTFTAPVADGHTFRTIGLGEFSACALATDGQAWCWGANFLEQLGHPRSAVSSATRPLAVDPLLSLDTLAVDVGGDACGLAAGILRCWGTFYGTASRPFGDSPTTFGALAIETQMTCVVDAGGEPSCWANFNPGSFSSYFGAPVSSLTVGSGFLCAVVSGGEARCQGSNAHGQLGNGGQVDAGSPEPVAGSRQWSSLSAGDGWTCGLSSDGTAYCWGANESGQLGTGDSVEVHVPAAVATGVRFRTIVTSGAPLGGTGSHRTCAIAMSHDLYCWGTRSKPRPAPVVY